MQPCSSHQRLNPTTFPNLILLLPLPLSNILMKSLPLPRRLYHPNSDHNNGFIMPKISSSCIELRYSLFSRWPWYPPPRYML